MKVRLKAVTLSMTAAILVTLLGIASVNAHSAPQGDRQTAEEEKPLMAEQAFKNVQVLRGIPVKEFMETMGFFAASLALTCTDCHGEESASDWLQYGTEPPLKQTARRDLTGLFVPADVRENSRGGRLDMPNKRYKAEQIVTLLRQIEVGIANGKTTPQVCKEAEITVQTYYRWRKEYGGLKLDQAKRLKELEKENAKLKRVVAELSLEKQVLKDIAEGNF